MSPNHICRFLVWLSLGIRTLPSIAHMLATSETVAFSCSFFKRCDIFCLIFFLKFFLWKFKDFFAPHGNQESPQQLSCHRHILLLPSLQHLESQIRPTILNYCSLCLEKQKKIIQVCDSLTMMQLTTNMSGSKQPKILSSFTSIYILWYCYTTKQSPAIMQS